MSGGGKARLPRLDPGSEFAGYRIERLVDRGGMGVVYEAHDIDLSRTVALKVIAPEHTLDADAVARFKSEVRLAASLEHPNIVPIYRGGEYGGILYLAMRFVRGTNLRQIMNSGPVSLSRLGRIITQVADALDAAHDRGLVHRDVKPANILVTGEAPNEHVYLADFGLTKRLGSHADLTQPGSWVGTADYVAPEQIQGQPLDRRADVYSLGCVVHEMLTAQVAYPKDSQVAKLWAHVNDPPPMPRTARPDLVQAFDDVVIKATAKDPAERYATAGQLALSLRDAIAQQEHARERAAGPTRFGAETSAPAGEPPTVLTPGGQPTADATSPASGWTAPPEPQIASAARVPAPPPGAPARPAGARRRLLAAGGLVLLACIVAAAVALLSGGGSGNGSASTAAEQVTGDLAPVPFNRVNGVGNVAMTLDGNVATVTLTANGLLNGSPHLMHIHAGKLGRCPPGSAARKHNGQLAIFTLDGAPFYGPVATALTTRGNTSPKSLLAFSRFPKTGTIHYKRKITLSPVAVAQIRANNAVVIVHGIDYNHNGRYDRSLEASDLNRRLSGESTAPGLCGPLVAPQPSRRQGNASAQATHAATVYTAVLTPAPEAPGAPPTFECLLPTTPGTRL